MDKINQLKHFDALDYKGEYFTNELKIQKLLYLKKVDLLEILV